MSSRHPDARSAARRLVLFVRRTTERVRPSLGVSVRRGRQRLVQGRDLAAPSIPPVDKVGQVQEERSAKQVGHDVAELEFLPL